MVTCIFSWSWISCCSRWCVTPLCCDNNIIILGEGPFPGQCSIEIVISCCWFNLKSASPHLQHLSLVELLWMCICSLNSSLCEFLILWRFSSEISSQSGFWIQDGQAELDLAVFGVWLEFLKLLNGSEGSFWDCWEQFWMSFHDCITLIISLTDSATSLKV